MQRAASDPSEDEIGEEDPDVHGWETPSRMQSAFPAISECARVEAQEDAAVFMEDDGYATDCPPRISYSPQPVRSRPPSTSAAKPSPVRRPAEPVHTSAPRARPITSGMVACVSAVVITIWECMAGAWELVRTFVEALRAALSITPMYEPRVDSPGSSAVRGALLALVMTEVATLFMQIGLVIAVGTQGAYADVVHIQYAETQVAALAAVPLGVYVYVVGGVDPTSPGGGHVYSLYMVCELFKAIGDAICAARLVAAFDDAHHVAAALAPAHVMPSTDPWDHGVCGAPHAVRACLGALAVLGAVLSGLNFVSLLGRNHAKAKVAEDAVPDPAPVTVPMPQQEEPPKRRRQNARRPAAPAPQLRPPPPPAPTPTQQARRPPHNPSSQYLLNALVDFQDQE